MSVGEGPPVYTDASYWFDGDGAEHGEDVIFLGPNVAQRPYEDTADRIMPTTRREEIKQPAEVTGGQPVPFSSAMLKAPERPYMYQEATPLRPDLQKMMTPIVDEPQSEGQPNLTINAVIPDEKDAAFYDKPKISTVFMVPKIDRKTPYLMPHSGQAPNTVGREVYRHPSPLIEGFSDEGISYNDNGARPSSFVRRAEPRRRIMRQVRSPFPANEPGMLGNLGQQVPSVQAIMLAGMNGSSGMGSLGANPFLAMRKAAKSLAKKGIPPHPAALAKAAKAKKAVRTVNRDERVKEAVGQRVAEKDKERKLKDETKRLEKNRQQEAANATLKAAKEAYSMAKTMERQSPGYMDSFRGTSRDSNPVPGFRWEQKGKVKVVVPLTGPARELFERALKAMKAQEQMLAEHAKVDQVIVTQELSQIAVHGLLPQPVQPGQAPSWAQAAAAAIAAQVPPLPETRTSEEIAATSTSVAKEVLSNWGLPANRENAFAVAQEVAVEIKKDIAQEYAVAQAEQALHEQKIQVIDSAMKKEGDYWGAPALPAGEGGSWY